MALLDRLSGQRLATDLRAGILAASVFNANGGIDGLAVQPWDLYPALERLRPTGVAAAKANAQGLAAAKLGDFATLDDVMILPRGADMPAILID